MNFTANSNDEIQAKNKRGKFFLLHRDLNLDPLEPWANVLSVNYVYPLKTGLVAFVVSKKRNIFMFKVSLLRWPIFHWPSCCLKLAGTWLTKDPWLSQVNSINLFHTCDFTKLWKIYWLTYWHTSCNKGMWCYPSTRPRNGWKATEGNWGFCTSNLLPIMLNLSHNLYSL